MADLDSGAFRQRYLAIEERLGRASTAEDRESIKAEIIALFKQAEQEIAQLSALRDDIKRL
ncbi:MAG TPA: hypothetical protein VL980_02025, partial [Gemmatimonadaceae bacterium]|nr:hypothetical protein [Gemmatimonadaceae bacterium]